MRVITIEFRANGCHLELERLSRDNLRLSKNKLTLLEGTDIETIVQRFRELVEKEIEKFVESLDMGETGGISHDKDKDC